MGVETTNGRCEAKYRVTLGDIHVACQLTTGHRGAHTANCPWDQNAVLIWPSDGTQCAATFPGISAYRCQRDTGHDGQHRAAMPWSDHHFAEWPATTSTTCGDV